MEKTIFELNRDYLLSTGDATTATALSAMVDEELSRDVMCRHDDQGKGRSIPVAPEWVTKPHPHCDLETHQVKRRNEKTNNGLMRKRQ